MVPQPAYLVAMICDSESANYVILSIITLKLNSLQPFTRCGVDALYTNFCRRLAKYFR